MSMKVLTADGGLFVNGRVCKHAIVGSVLGCLGAAWPYQKLILPIAFRSLASCAPSSAGLELLRVFAGEHPAIDLVL